MSYSESDWLRATKHTHFTFRGVFTYLTVITINMIVFVHGYYSNGFIRPLERKKKNKKKQNTEGNLTRKCSTLSFCSTSQFDKSFKRSIRSLRPSMKATSWMIRNSSASKLWSSSAWQSSLSVETWLPLAAPVSEQFHSILWMYSIYFSLPSNDNSDESSHCFDQKLEHSSVFGS